MKFTLLYVPHFEKLPSKRTALLINNYLFSLDPIYCSNPIGGGAGISCFNFALNSEVSVYNWPVACSVVLLYRVLSVVYPAWRLERRCPCFQNATDASNSDSE